MNPDAGTTLFRECMSSPAGETTSVVTTSVVGMLFVMSRGVVELGTIAHCVGTLVDVVAVVFAVPSSVALSPLLVVEPPFLLSSFPFHLGRHAMCGIYS
jgi:hypothetical protein